MLRVRELAATEMERSSVKAGMTKAGHGDWRGLRMTEAGHGDRAWRLDMETGHGDQER